MRPQEQAERKRCLLRVAADFSVDRWAGRRLVDVATLHEDRPTDGLTALALVNGAQIA
ncbi:MAG: hypothetical protein JST54_09965 [Deltaproteobacteria bacterium]|nr:hypothetical protein [Deltaproteobacteria bacterium]